jgi:ABC-type transport system involved in multi-copper enzyme maturation permease subunit
MSRRFEIYQDDQHRRLAVPCGFSLTAAVFDWIWALWLQLWLQAIALFFVNALTTYLLVISKAQWPTYVLLQVAQGIAVGFGARKLRSMSAERRGFAYLCTIEGTNGPNALAKLDAVGGTPLAEWRPRMLLALPDFTPRGLQGLFAITRLTVKAALRFKLVLVLLALLMGAVVVLPMIIKHDGSAQGFTQILITYTLTAITSLLGFATLWLACGSLASEVEDFSMQLICTKPVARWQIWLGKWLGIMVLNAALLAVAGVTVYFLLLAKAGELSPGQQTVLRNEVLVARKSAHEAVPDFEPDVERFYQERAKQQAVAGLDRDFVRKQIREQIKASRQFLPPGQGRRWELNLGADAVSRLKDQPLYVRVKYFTPEYNGTGVTYDFGWEVGPPEGHVRQRLQNSFGPESFTTFAIEPNHIAADGKLYLDGFNLNEKPVLIPLEDGLEVLYREGGFGLNFARGLGIIFCWLSLLCAIGLFAASKLQFNVAAFVSFAILIVGLSSGTLKQVVEQGGVIGVSSEDGVVTQPTLLNQSSVLVYGGLRWVIEEITGYNPVDSLSTGRSVTWTQLATAMVVVIGVAGGLFAVGGIWIFSRRELAAPQ